jgi:hypothetical protein
MEVVSNRNYFRGRREQESPSMLVLTRQLDPRPANRYSE